MHLYEMFREVYEKKQLEEERIEELHESGERVVEMIVEEEEDEEEASKIHEPQVRLKIEHGLNPFASLVYQQHTERPNQLRKSNWGLIKISYEVV